MVQGADGADGAEATLEIPSKSTPPAVLPASKDDSSDLSDHTADTPSSDPANSSDVHATTPIPINGNEETKGDGSPPMGRGARNKKHLAQQGGSVAAKNDVAQQGGSVAAKNVMAQQTDSIAANRPRRASKRKAEDTVPGAPNGRSQPKRR
jgi:hypothetical protein